MRTHQEIRDELNRARENIEKSPNWIEKKYWNDYADLLWCELRKSKVEKDVIAWLNNDNLEVP